MKLKGMKITALGLAASMICAASSAFAGVTAVAAGQTYTLNGAGQHKGTGPDGYSYEIWAADTNQPSSMTLGDNGTFTTKWNCAGPSGNFLARRGIGMGSTKKFQDYGGITCDFDVNWSASSQGNSRLCIYGWTQNPLVEYYIVEDWKNWCPPNGSPGAGSPLGSVDLDGAKYYIYKENRNSYTIEGNKPFVQYFSVRSSGRTNGTISVSKHFEAWESKGLQMGKMYEVAFNVEGWESNGEANVKKNTITLGKEPEPEKPVEPDANGYYLTEGFESGEGDWTGRGSAKVKSSSGYDGSKGLYVSDRADNWNGASISLPSNPFKGGETFAFGAAVMQDTEESVEFKLTLQYSDASGTETYSEVKTATGAKGQWVDLSNSAYTIPEGATNLVLYVEAPKSLTDFYVDGAYAAVKGTGPLISVKNAEPVVTTTTTQQPVVITTTTTQPNPYKPSGVTMWGDTNLDNTVELSDAILVMQFLANPNKYGYTGSESKHMTEQGALNGDVYESGEGLTANDALAIQKKLLNLIPSLPESYAQGHQPAATTTTTKPATTTTTSTTTTTTTTTIVTTTTTAPPAVYGGMQDKGTPMNKNATMVSDFRTGNAGDFFASDGWTNGKPFDCWWYKRNAVIGGGALELSVDQKWTNDSNPDWNPQYSGGEFRTNNFYHYGYYETSMQAIKNDGVVSSFFTYTGPSDNNPWDEIDIEILGKDTTKVQLNYYTDGVGKHEYMYDLGFDSSEAFHTYGFDWQPDHITWYVDGKAVYTAYQNIPKTPGKIMMNAWPGRTVDDWLKAFNGRTPLKAHYQWVTYNKQ